MKHLVLLLSMHVLMQSLLAQDTSYYDNGWKPCNKSAASFARVVKIGKVGYEAKDYYYPAWKIQMTGAYEDNELKIKTGNFVYFYPDGIVKTLAYYESDELNDWYIEFDSTGFPKDSIFCKRDKKDGISKFYHKNKYLWYTETYVNGLLNDSTITYYPDGKIKRIEIYENTDLKLGLCFDKNGKKIPYTPLFQFPGFADTNEDLYPWLAKNLIYPKSMQKLNMDGRVEVSFEVAENGELTNIKVNESTDNEFTEAALNTLKKMPRWKFAKLDDEYIALRFTLPIRFSLTD
jgi:TonB family protein